MSKPNMNLCAALAFLSALPLAAADLTLAVDGAMDWASSSTIWTTDSSAENVKFSPGDNILVTSGSYTGQSLRMLGRYNPGDVVFDIAGSLKFGWSNANNGLGPGTKSFTKRGGGTLILTSSLNGSAVNASGGTDKGNGMTNGVDIAEGEIACLDRNSHNYLGPRTVPFPVRVRNGASLSFLEGNQTGSHVQPECGIQIRLDSGSHLNYITNTVDASGNTISSTKGALCVNTLELAGGDVKFGSYGYIRDDSVLGGNVSMLIYNALHFSGGTPHAFGLSGDAYAGCKSYLLSQTFRKAISLNPFSPVEIRVDDIDNGSGVDAYVNMQMFTWGTNTMGVFRSDIVKTGPGTLNFPVSTVNKTFLGDFAVREGVAEFEWQGFFPSDGNEEQTITVSTNGTFRAKIRNVVKGSLLEKPAVDVVVDHGRFEFVPTDGIGCFRARNFTFDGAQIVLKSQGHNPTSGKYTGVLCSMGTMSFKGDTPYVLEPDATLDSTDHQAINVYNDPRTVFDVSDITADGRTDVTVGYPLWNYSTNGTSNAGFLADCGFVKTGAGTLSIACPADTTSGYGSRFVSGVVTVSNGVMRVDGTLTSPSSVEVAAGAYLGGTGTVANVTMEAGSGFAALAGDAQALAVQGDLALPATGTVEISNPGSLAEESIGRVSFASATGTLSGTGNLKNWTVKIDGEPTGRWQVYADGNTVKAKMLTGLVISFR